MTEAQIVALIVDFLPVLVALAAAIYRYYGHRSPQAKQQLVSDLANTVVPAIEQACSDMSGEHKKLTAYQNMTGILKSLHVGVSPALVNLAIESAVYSLNAASGPATDPVLPDVPATPAASTGAN